MKKLLTFLFLAISFTTIAQTILNIGTPGYVTINSANYKRGYLGSSYFKLGADSVLGININSGPQQVFIYQQKASSYLDGDHGNTPFASMAALKTWMNANFEPIPDTIYVGGGGGGSGTVTSVGLSVPDVFSVTPTPITSSGTFLVNFNGGKSQNQVLATPSGSAGPLGLRVLTALDIPATLTSSTTGNAATATALLNTRTINSVPFNGTASITVYPPSLGLGTGTAGSTTNIPVITYADDGRITAISTVSVSASGFVSTVSVANANGFVGASSGGSNPTITLQSTIVGMLKGVNISGTGSIIAATAGTDYVVPSVATLSSLTATGTIISGGLGSGAVLGPVTMTLGSDASYDMYVRNSSGVLTRIPNGTTGQYLMANSSGIPTWSNMQFSQFNNQTGSSYTLVIGDAWQWVTSNNAGAVSFTVPNNSSVAFATNTTIQIINYGAGKLTFNGASGVTVNSSLGYLSLVQGASAFLQKTGTNTWWLSGGISN